MPKEKRVYPEHIVRLACELYESGMTRSEIEAVFPKGYKVQRILERHTTMRKGGHRDQRGPKNHMWVGDDATYGSIHDRIRNLHGRAADHSCVDCGGTAAQWSFSNDCDAARLSHVNAWYCPHVEHYQPRCVGCHFKFDEHRRQQDGRFAPLEPDTTDWDDPLLRRNRGWQERGRAS